MIRSPFFYVGDKYKLMPQLRKHFPKKFKNLIEPFVGGGSVFLNTEAKHYVGNDSNSYMIKLHNFLYSYKGRSEQFFKDFEDIIKKYNLSASFLGHTVSQELKSKHKKTYYAVYNKEAYLKIRDEFNKNKNDLMKLYVLLIYGFNHMLRFNGSGEFNLPVGNVDYNKNVNKALHVYFNFIDKHDVEFSNLDFREFLNNREYDADDFVYLDPPYLISACEYNKGWDETCEIDLLNIIDELNTKGVKFALSNVFIHKGQDNNLLIEWSKKYNVINVKSNYISYHDNSIKETVEVLITNY